MVVAAVAHRQAGGRAGQGGVDPRGGHPARRLSPGLSRHDRRDPVGRQDGRPGSTRSPARRCIARWLPPAFQKGVDIDAVDSAVDMPYDIPNFHVEYVRAEPPAVPTGFWRGVGPAHNVFVIECFMDELARKAGKDPVEFRSAHAGQAAAHAGGAQPGGGEIRLGPAAAGPRRPGRLPAALVRQLHRNGGGSRGGRRGRGQTAPRELAWWTPASPSTPTPSWRRSRAG